ncbi:sterol esterase [Ophiostoma piceae UAMH 11346]|uniref:Sterol esterase n=1 Tax=Ophiostoma piceae (strain UAMH 11346) TaxID=1262450 RepID=S3CA17_OPHP1|nr:sterol esterase [Ophiostoma piceae UAMH 11346]
MSSFELHEAADAQTPDADDTADIPQRTDEELAEAAVAYSKQSEKLSLQRLGSQAEGEPVDVAVEARFITPQDPVIVTSSGNRLPPVPLSEAHKLNMLKDELQGDKPNAESEKDAYRLSRNAESSGSRSRPGTSNANEIASAEKSQNIHQQSQPASPSKHRRYFPFLQRSAEGTLQKAMPPSHTNPLFPPLPLYGPPSILRNLQSSTFRVSSFVLSLSFLGVIVLGSLFTSVPGAIRRTAYRLTLRDPDAHRPLYLEEKRRHEMRQEMDRSWKRRRLSEERIVHHEKTGSIAMSASAASATFHEDNEAPAGAGIGDSTYKPTEGGPDPLVPDVAHYARRVGLDVEKFKVQTEDGFIIDLWHVYDPSEHTPRPPDALKHRGPELLFDETTSEERDVIQQKMFAERRVDGKKPKFPVLLVHGLLQSAGAYCVNDDDSLAFYLCKSGYDVWLGNNRAGFQPEHAVLKPSDPRMWCWNIRQMGVFDLPALTSRVLRETRFARLGLVCHSQGTTEALVALAKEQRPELGQALTVFCALAPAAYSGRLVEKMYFKFMRIISPGMFRIMFGIHSFIPLMMQVHPMIPGRVYGWMGYRVFSFLFEWSDVRWDRGLRNRMFQFAPVYVSAESMRWWLGREGFARHKCILSTKEEWYAEERAEEEEMSSEAAGQPPIGSRPSLNGSAPSHRHRPPGSTAWYDERVPPFALWVCGRDDLVDGRRLLKRFLPRPAFAALDRGKGSRSTSSGLQRSSREPHVRVVHAKLIPEYEHLDVLWAMDAVDEVFSELREVLWKTCTVRESCRIPKGCENVEQWQDPKHQESEAEGQIVCPRPTRNVVDENDESSSSETDAA